MRIVVADEISPGFLPALGHQVQGQARQGPLPPRHGRPGRGLHGGGPPPRHHDREREARHGRPAPRAVSRGPSRRVSRCPAQRRALSFGLLDRRPGGLPVRPAGGRGRSGRGALGGPAAARAGSPRTARSPRRSRCAGRPIAAPASSSRSSGSPAPSGRPPRPCCSIPTASPGRSRAPAGRPAPVATVASATPIREADATGFVLSLGRRDGSKPPAFGAALGRRQGGDLRIVLAIGEDPRACRGRRPPGGTPASRSPGAVVLRAFSR